MAKNKKCGECEEPVRNVSPRGAGTGRSLGVPAEKLKWSHTDGEPLCPVMGPNGYEPGEPTD